MRPVSGRRAVKKVVVSHKCHCYLYQPKDHRKDLHLGDFLLGNGVRVYAANLNLIFPGISSC
jgi:hypothetical protein